MTTSSAYQKMLNPPPSPLPDFLEEVSEGYVSFIVGSHLHGTATRDSDKDYTVVYLDIEDDRKAFRKFPEVWHSPCNNVKVYSLRKFAQMVYAGNFNQVEVIQHYGNKKDAPAWWVTFALRVKPYLYVQRYFNSIRGHMKSVMNEENPSPKRLAHSVRLGFEGIRVLTGMTPYGGLATVREIKLGLRSDGMEILRDTDAKLTEALEGSQKIADDSKLEQQINDYFVYTLALLEYFQSKAEGRSEKTEEVAHTNSRRRDSHPLVIIK